MTPDDAQKLLNAIEGLRQIGERVTIALASANQGLGVASAILDRAEATLREVISFGHPDN